MNLFEMLANRELDPLAEINRLEQLFDEENVHYHVGLRDCSLKKYLNGPFRLIPMRSTFLSIEDMIENLQILKSPVCDGNDFMSAYFEKLFLFCELLYNLLDQTSSTINSCSSALSVANSIRDNIREILEKTNHEMKKIKDGFIVVDKNPATTEVIECLEEKDSALALEMIEYNRVLLKGNLKRKSEILKALADYTEPMNNIFNASQYKSLYNDSRYLVNAIDIRHNNSGKGDLPEKAKSWTPQEKEDWYDKTYQILLTVILVRKHMDVSKEIQTLKG